MMGGVFEIQVPFGGVNCCAVLFFFALAKLDSRKPMSMNQSACFFCMFRSHHFVRWWSIFTTSRWWKRSWFQSTSQWRHWKNCVGPLVGNVFMGRWVEKGSNRSYQIMMFFIMFLRFRTNWLEKLLCIPNWPRRNQTKCNVGQTLQLTTMHSSCFQKTTQAVIFLSLFHVYRFQNLRIDNEFYQYRANIYFPKCLKFASHRLLYIYILYTIATPDDMDPNSLRLPEVLIFSRTLGDTQTQIESNGLGSFHTHTTLTISSWMMKCCPSPFSITTLFHPYLLTHIFISKNISPGDKRKDLGGTQVCAKDCGIQANPCSCSSASKDAWRWGWGGGGWWWTWLGWRWTRRFFFFNEKKRF